MEYWVAVLASFAVGLFCGLVTISTMSSKSLTKQSKKTAEYAKKYYRLKDKLKRLVEDN